MDYEQLKKTVKHSKYVPYDPTQRTFSCLTTTAHEGGLQPYQYTGWRDEARSWHETCYIHAGLNPHNTHRLKGPDSIKLLKDKLVNKIDNWPIGKGKHTIACNEQGLIMADGVIFRFGQDEFVGTEMAYLVYLAERDHYNVTFENLTEKQFNFQMAGPKSLEIIEKCTEDELRDIDFMWGKAIKIDQKDVFVVRLGMAGTLGYEIHGKAEDAVDIYRYILEKGEPLGLKQLGLPAYGMTHIEGGFAQNLLDFLEPWSEDQGFVEWMVKNKDGMAVFGNKEILSHMLSGSAGQEVSLRYRNPIELGWIKECDFNRDFIGKKVLLQELNDPKRVFVTLEWDPEDLTNVFREAFEPDSPLYGITDPNDFGSNLAMVMDKVVKDGEIIGYTGGRMFSSFYRQMISTCIIEIRFGQIGTEVYVVRGTEGTKQRLIKARVARHPYIHENRNEMINVHNL